MFCLITLQLCSTKMLYNLLFLQTILVFICCCRRRIHPLDNGRKYTVAYCSGASLNLLTLLSTFQLIISSALYQESVMILLAYWFVYCIFTFFNLESGKPLPWGSIAGVLCLDIILNPQYLFGINCLPIMTSYKYNHK